MTDSLGKLKAVLPDAPEELLAVLAAYRMKKRYFRLRNGAFLNLENDGLEGIARLVDDKTPEDHIGLMLVLMAWIARNRPEALDDFLRLHLLPWSSHFLDELAEAAEESNK